MRICLLCPLLVIVGLYEGVHGAVMRFFGAQPEFGILWRLGAAYATAPGYAFTRNQFVVIALAPLVVLSLLGGLLLAWLPGWLIPAAVIFLSLNAAGAAGDLWMTVVVLRYPPDAQIMDERDGVRVFLPEQQFISDQ